jgi:hypothetical protein
MKRSTLLSEWQRQSRFVGKSLPHPISSVE